MLGQLSGPGGHEDIVGAGHRDGCKARDRRVCRQQRVGGWDVQVVEGQQPDAGHLRGPADAEELDAEVADSLAGVPPEALHERPGVVGLAVSRAVDRELHDHVLGRGQVLEPLIGGDSVLGCLHRVEARAGQRQFDCRLPARVPDCLDDRLVLGRALPDPALERFQGSPDPRRSRCHGEPRSGGWRVGMVRGPAGRARRSQPARPALRRTL